MSRCGGYWLAALALLPAACDSDLAHDWTGRACRERAPRCLTGFQCDEGRCIPLTSNAGTGGASGSTAIEPIPDPASGGAGAGPVPIPEPPGGSGGGGGVGPADAGADPLDAGVTPEPGDAAVDGGLELDAGAPIDAGAEPDACTPTTLFEDVDGDSYGNPNVSVEACGMSGWVEVAGDCRDDLVGVHPGAGFFGVGYDSVSSPEGKSFDYDCSGGEQPDPTNTPAGAEPNCSSMIPVLCSGAGYDTTARSGVNVSNLCGSTTVVTCETQGLSCGSDMQTGMPAFRCR